MSDDPEEKVSLDRFRGAFIGLVIGDALGAPHERHRSKPLSEYKGKLVHNLVVRSRYRGSKIYPSGTYTDDTEMMLALSRSIADSEGYNPEDAIARYSTWATSGGFGMGQNTRELFTSSRAKSKQKRIEGYTRRYEGKFGCPPGFTEGEAFKCIDSNNTESNGSLMRCLPLCLLDDESLIVDCCLSNPNILNVNVEKIYIRMIYLNLQGYHKKKVDEFIRVEFKDKQYRQVMKLYKLAISEGQVVSRNVKENGGWVLHAFYLAIKAYYLFEEYQEAIDFVVLCGGDTDTNAAITGALIGSYLGYKNMMKEERTKFNYKVVMEASEQVRHEDYSIGDWKRLTRKLVELF